MFLCQYKNGGKAAKSNAELKAGSRAAQAPEEGRDFRDTLYSDGSEGRLQNPLKTPDTA